MISKNNLNILINSINYTNKLNSFTNKQAITLASGNYIQIGYKKDISQYYVDLEIPSIVSAEMTVEAYVNGSWTAIEFDDETDGFTKSGYINIEKVEKTEVSNLKEIRISFNQSISFTINGINLVFCSLDDLKGEEPSIMSFLPRGSKTAILSQLASTKYILRKINNSGSYKYNGINVSQINQFDFFNINEVRDCAIFYTLHKIFDNRSDESGDVYREKANLYLEKFNACFKVFSGAKLSLDLDDDGKESVEEEIESISHVTFER